MSRRLIILLIILLMRLSLGWMESLKYDQNSVLRVTGNIDNIYRTDTECVISVGRFWINYRSECSFSRMMEVQVIGKVESGVIDRFLGRLWLSNAKLSLLDSKTLASIPDDIFLTFLDRLRENIASVYRRNLPDPESGLVAGIVLGYKKDIGQKMYQLMINSGTIHIAVASGYNIMLVGGTIVSLCFWLMKRKWASIIAILMMIFYALEAGGEPPVVRAVIMAGVVFWAAVVGRRVISWWILLVTGWLMVLWEPLFLINVSFQLSMAASVGLMVVEPMINRGLSVKHEKLVEVLSGSGVLTTLSTMILTAPIIWWHFGRMSWIGALSNILILPLVPLLMIFGAAMQILPVVFYWPTYVMAHWMVEVIRFFGS